MNVSRIISPILVVAAMIFMSNGTAVEFRNYTSPAAVFAGSVFIKEKKVAELFGEKYISARNQVIIGKSVSTGVGHLITNLNENRWSFENYQDKIIKVERDPDMIKEGKTVCYQKFAGHVIVNGALRVGGNKYLFLNEESID